jgi:hypothetical protein
LLICLLHKPGIFQSLADYIISGELVKNANILASPKVNYITILEVPGYGVSGGQCDWLLVFKNKALEHFKYRVKFDKHCRNL